MNALKSMVLGSALACLASCPTYAWSIKSSDKTHVRICAIDEDRKPVEGVEVLVRMNYGRGSSRKFITDKDGLVSFQENVGACAICEFVLDETNFYGFDTRFWPQQSGTIVTGVVKKIAMPSKMVELSFSKFMTNDVRKVGLDLLLGDLVLPYGNGKHADVYVVNKVCRDSSITDCSEWNRYYMKFWLDRGDSPSEFTFVDVDAGCGLPTPALAPTHMECSCDVKFKVDNRPNRQASEHIGDKKYAVFKLVRSQGEFYGIIKNGDFHIYGDNGEMLYDVQMAINTVPGDRGLVGRTYMRDTDAWRKRVEAWYAEEDAEKKKTVK